MSSSSSSSPATPAEDPNILALTDIPIASEHAAASLSLADVNYEGGKLGASSSSSTDEDDFPMETILDAPYASSSHHQQSVVPKLTVQAIQPRRRDRQAGWCLFVIILIVIVVSIVRITKPKHRQPQSFAPTAPVASIQEIVDYISLHDISSYDDLVMTGTPQYTAVQWLANQDAARLPVPADDDPLHDRYLYVVRYILAVTYFAWEGPSWKSQLNFLSGDDVCQWHGIKETANALGSTSSSLHNREYGGLICQDGVPVTLDLEYNELSGTIPIELGFLTSLEKLDIQHNIQLTGLIPDHLCRLSNLRYLSLSSNDHEGNIPSCLWTELETLMLSQNSLSGSLPKEVCQRTKMRHFSATDNILTGSIPSCMGEWTNLQDLRLSNNQLEGSLPNKLAQLTNLQELFIDQNYLEGNPSHIWNEMTSLRLLYAENNEFDGRLSSNFLRNATLIEAIDISENNFTSHTIPTHLFHLPNLNVMDLSSNSLKGHVPTDIPLQDSLWFLSLHENKLDGGIPSQLQNLQALRHLDLSNNQFHGPLRNEVLGNMLKLQHLFLGENPGLHPGQLPASLSTMTHLTELSLKNTNRQGPLPDLTDFADLQILDLDNNNFTHTIPEQYGSLSKLQYLLLSRNPLLGGNLPNFINTPYLHTVLLDGTNITGGFDSLCALPAFQDRKPWGEEVVTSDCDATYHCECCHCCPGETTCSGPLVDSLDWTWEYGFRRQAHDLGLNRSQYQSPIDG